jgi:hypothetical protein
MRLSQSAGGAGGVRRGTGVNVKESHVLRGVLDLLAAEGIPHYRLNSGALMVAGRRIRLCPEGTPDVLAIWPWWRHFPSTAAIRQALAVFIECKRPEAGRLTEAQEREHRRLREAGAFVLVIDDIGGLQKLLRGPG